MKNLFGKNCFILNFSDLGEKCIVCEDLPASNTDLMVTNEFNRGSKSKL